MMENKFKYTAGWCLLDFPLNYDQAQEIEKYLTGFLVENDKEVPISETLKAQARILAQATPRKTTRRTVRTPPHQKPPPPLSSKLKESGIDAVLVVDVDKNNCLRRAFGRRVDPENQEMFHLDESPPPVDDDSKVTRLTCFDDPYNSEVRKRRWESQ